MTESFRESVRTLLRERLLDAAAEITVDGGWSQVTMAKVAERVGVSRQTVYNELGSKPQIAEDLVFRELEKFLEVIATRLESHDDVVEGLGDACLGALEMGADNALLKAVVSTAHVGSNDLLPLLTTQADELIERAGVVVAGIVDEHYDDFGLSSDELGTAIDMIVRLVLSNILQPGRSPQRTATDLTWLARRVLGRTDDR